jgi:hypothetical protein
VCLSVQYQKKNTKKKITFSPLLSPCLLSSSDCQSPLAASVWEQHHLDHALLMITSAGVQRGWTCYNSLTANKPKRDNQRP